MKLLLLNKHMHSIVLTDKNNDLTHDILAKFKSIGHKKIIPLKTSVN